MDRPEHAFSSPDRPVQQCREIFLRQLGAASDELQGAKPNVHGARKQLKRARATLRLLRPALDDDQYRQENTVARDAARPLSKARDDDVVRDALEGLLEHCGPAASEIQVGPLRQRLHQGRGRAAHALSANELTKIRAALRLSIQRAQAWEPALDGWECIATGLHKTYKRARRALRNARAERATDALHEWRKQTKYVWHQLQALTPAAPGAIGELADEFHHLADYLGDEHDLAVLRERAASPSSGLSKAATTALDALISRRRDELQAKAFSLGERLYAPKPKPFVHHLTNHWSDWS